jgi:cytochrome c biogenesis protein CcmG/thiol:disulfide interchange protein DsbE
VKKRIKLGLAVAGVVLLLIACTQPDPPFVKAEKDRQSAPEFSLQDASGSTFKLSDYKGKVVLLNFWATWCGPCQEEIPWFMGFEREYKDRDFAVVGISVDETGWNAVKPYLKRRQVNYRVALANQSVTQLYGSVEGLPTTFMIDRQGRIARTHIGLASQDTYRDEIVQLLGSNNSDDSHRISMLQAPGRIDFAGRWFGWLWTNRRAG